MKKLISTVAIAALIVLSSCTNEVEKEVIKTVYVTPSGEELPDSLQWFFSDESRVQAYEHTKNELARWDSYTNSSPDYIIVSFGRNKSALNLPNSNLLPCNCITFTSFRNNTIISFIHYRIKDWGQEWKSEDMPNSSTAIKWNYQFFDKEFVYELVPGSGSKTTRQSIKVDYNF